MAEISSNTWPENYVELRPKVEQVQVVEKARDVCLPVWVSIIETCGKVNYLIDLSKIQLEKAQLKEEIEFNKPEFIEKLKQLPDYEGSKVKEAIEKGTIEIKKIHWRDAFAIYESQTWNIIYITGLKWEQYINLDHFRNKDFFWDALKGGFISQWYKWIVYDEATGLWRLYNKEGAEVLTFSDEYSVATLNSVNYLFDAMDFIEEQAKKESK